MPVDPTTVVRTVLPNGLTVLIRRDRSAPVAAVVTYVKAGYFDETDAVVGVSHVLEHMYFKGTPTRGVGAIARETKASGGYLNAHTIYDHTSYYAVVPADGFAAALAVQADAYANSLVDAAELGRELEVIVQEARRKQDNAAAVARETLFALLHDAHRIRRWRIGTEEELRRLTRDDVVGFYRNFYRPGNTVVSIAGDLDPDETLALVTRLYGDQPAGDPVYTPGPDESATVHALRYRELSGDVQQAQLVMGWRTPGLADPRTPALDIAAAVLGAGRGSRLYRDVRERQLASGISASNYTPGDLGVFTVHAETRPGAVTEAAGAAWRAVRTLGEDGPSPLELERARRLTEAGWLRRLETMDGQATYLAEWEAVGDWQLGARYLEQLLSCDAEAVASAVREHLTLEHMATVVYRPDDAPAIAPDADAFRRSLVAAHLPASAIGAEPSPIEAPAVIVAPVAERVVDGVHVFRTPHGVPVLVRQKPGAPVTYAGVFAVGGARDEGADRSGLTKLLARTAVKGTANRNAAQLAAEIELLGGGMGASIGAESFGWTVSAPTRHLGAALSLLADVVQRPAFPDNALETERVVALADVTALRDDMYRYPVRLALEAAFGDHPYGVSALGDERTLRAITPTSLTAWHAERVLHAPIVIGIVGDVDPAEAAAAAASRFDHLEWREPAALTEPSWPAAPVSRAEARDKAQTGLALALPAPSRRDPARFAAELLADVASGLGGRFFEELRDRRSLGYSVHLSGVARTRAGLFLAYIGTAPEREDEAREGLMREFARFAEEPVTEEELQRAQTYSIGTHAIARQTGGSLLGEMVDAWLLGEGLEEIDGYPAHIRAVSREAIQAVAAASLEHAWIEGVVRGQPATVDA